MQRQPASQLQIRLALPSLCPLAVDDRFTMAGAGADPTKLIEELAKRKKIKTLGVSMGQGQEVIARKYVAIAMAEGRWVLLQNTHLGLGYLSEVTTLKQTSLDGLHWVCIVDFLAYKLIQLSPEASTSCV